MSKDMFCENSFWRGRGFNPGVADPVCMVTGGVMFLMPFFNNVLGDGPVPPLFWLCKGTLGLVGIGTMFFHALTVERAQELHLNHYLMDWLPITMMCNAILLLYLSNLLVLAERGWTVLLIALCVWSGGLAMLIDSDTKSYLDAQSGGAGGQSVYGTALNVLLLLPLGAALAYAGWYKEPFRWSQAWPLWSALFIVLLLWVFDAYLCQTHPELFLFHALYHVVVAYAFLYSACLGVCLDERRWEFVRVGLWPHIRYVWAGVLSGVRMPQPPCKEAWPG